MESEFKVSAPTSSVEMVLWWSTLAPDEQIPLQVSYSPLSNDYKCLPSWQRPTARTSRRLTVGQAARNR